MTDEKSEARELPEFEVGHPYWCGPKRIPMRIDELNRYLLSLSPTQLSSLGLQRLAPADAPEPIGDLHGVIEQVGFYIRSWESAASMASRPQERFAFKRCADALRDVLLPMLKEPQWGGCITPERAVDREELKREYPEPSGEPIIRNMSTPESREFWESAERGAAEVEDWPAWKRAGINTAQMRAEPREPTPEQPADPCAECEALPEDAAEFEMAALKGFAPSVEPVCADCCGDGFKITGSGQEYICRTCNGAKVQPQPAAEVAGEEWIGELEEYVRDTLSRGGTLDVTKKLLTLGDLKRLLQAARRVDEAERDAMAMAGGIEKLRTQLAAANATIGRVDTLVDALSSCQPSGQWSDAEVAILHELAAALAPATPGDQRGGGGEGG